MKTAVTKRNAVLKIFFTAFLAYFLSESMLRQAAVAKVTAKGLSVDSIIMKLPESIRSTVKKHIEISRLQDDLKNAETEAAKIRALINLANASGDKMELSRTLAQIMQNYPDNPASAPAYRFFFRHASDKANRISISEMQRFILILPEKDRISMWEFGTNRLRETGAGNNEIIDFLNPLLATYPKYKEYKKLYISLAEAAFEAKRNQIETEARVREEHAEEMPSIETAEEND